MKTALVLGAGGFIGSHMVKRLKSEGYWVRGVDLKEPEFSESQADDFMEGDLRDPNLVSRVMFGPDQKELGNGCFDELYQFAADMGGAGYIFTGDHDADVMQNSALINLHVAQRAKNFGVKKLFYSSSACMYPYERQYPLDPDSYSDEAINLHEKLYSAGLSEDMAYPANPDSEYGWEKIFSERLYLAYARNYDLNVRIARFHNIYGPEGTYTGGKEKAPAAICRKVAESVRDISFIISKGGTEVTATIPIWGDGQQTRSFLYIDDCIDAVRLLMESDFKEPINIGSEEMISINDLAKMVIDITGKNIHIKNIDGPVGVRGRNSDNTLIREKLGWEPKYTLRQGMEKLYSWVKSQYLT